MSTFKEPDHARQDPAHAMRLSRANRPPPVGRESYSSTDTQEVAGPIERADLRAGQIALEDRYRIAFESAAGGMAVIALSGRFLQVNRTACELLGRSEDELLSMSCQQITHPECPADDAGCLRPLLRGDVDVLRPEIRVIHSTGDMKWIRVSLTISRDEHQTPLAVIGHLEDVTERKHAEGELRDSEERFRKIFEEGQIGIALVGSDLRTIKTNPALCRILGYTADELQALKFPDVTHPADVDTDLGLVEALFRGEIPYYQIEKRFIRKGGEQVWASLTVSLIRDGDDQPLYALGMVEDITERKTAQEALRRSEAYLSESQRLSRTGSFAWNAARQENTYWSAEVNRILGIDPVAGVVPYQEAREFIHPDDRLKFDEFLERGLLEKTDVEFIFRIVLRDGSTKHLHVITHPILDATGIVTDLLGTCMDVTEQHQARVALEQALSEFRGSEDRLRLAIDTIPAYVDSCLPDGTCDFVNKRWRDFFGPGLPDLTAIDWVPLVHPDDVQRAGAEWGRAIARGTDFELQLRLKRADGQYRWILNRFVPLRDTSGGLVKWYGTGFDIEDRIRAEQELQASERRYRHIVEDQLDLVVRWLPGGVRTFANRAYCEYFGQSLEQVAGTSFFPLIHEVDQEQVRRRIEALTPANPVSRGENRVIRPDGTSAWSEWTDRAIFDEQGKLVELQSVGRDITERKKTEKRSQDAALTTARFSLLSNREREVLDLVVAGMANKVIAQQLRITERTVEKHRANVMRKLQAQSAAELVRLALIAQQSNRDR